MRRTAGRASRRHVLALALTASLAFAWLAPMLPAFAADRPLGPPPAPPQVEISQQLDAALPLDLPLMDAQGRAVRLGDYFADGKPVVLVLGYYSCPNLCGIAMHGVLEALHDTGLRPGAYRIIGVSIDPLDTPASALDRQQVYMDYAAFLNDGSARPAPPDLQLLVGAAARTEALAQRVGFAYQVDRDSASAPAGSNRAKAEYIHAAGMILATPSGRVSRYFLGVRFDPAELRLALVEASSGRIGTLTDRLLLLCAHFDPVQGRYSLAVMNLMRIIGVLLAVALASWIWRRRQPSPKATGAGRR